MFISMIGAKCDVGSPLQADQSLEIKDARGGSLDDLL
jgi:hypothetical protein